MQWWGKGNKAERERERHTYDQMRLQALEQLHSVDIYHNYYFINPVSYLKSKIKQKSSPWYRFLKTDKKQDKKISNFLPDVFMNSLEDGRINQGSRPSTFAVFVQHFW
jgi:hypothetical protein